jgi:hypothetical protein
MKNLVFLLFVAVFFAACLKTTPTPQPDRILTYMNFSNIQQIDSSVVGDTVKINVIATGPNSCYKFEGFEGKTSGIRQYDIAAVGSIPNPAKGDTICAGGEYIKDTVFTVLPLAAGPMILRYYNSGVLYLVDTIHVK